MLNYTIGELRKTFNFQVKVSRIESFYDTKSLHLYSGRKRGLRMFILNFPIQFNCSRHEPPPYLPEASSHPGTYVFNWKMFAKRPPASKGNVFPLPMGVLHTGFNVVKYQQSKKPRRIDVTG